MIPLVRLQIAIVLSLGLCGAGGFFAATPAQVGTVRSAATGADYLHLQQAQTASDYYRYAKSTTNSYSYNQYGHFGPTFERVDNILSKGRQHFTDYEVNELSSRIYGLKQKVSASVSQGLEPLEYQDDVANLEAEVNRKVDDSLLNISSVERQLAETLSRVEQLYGANKGQMSQSDREELEARISRLRDKSVRENLVSIGISHSAYSVDFVDEARKIESAIIGKTLFSHGGSQAKATNPNTSKDSGSGETATGQSAPASAAANSPPKLRSGLTAYRLQPVTQRDITPPVSQPTLAKAFEKTENRLLELHEAERLGTFDIDVFSERLLKLKYNCRKMVSDKGKLSPRQENWLRVELGKINDDISDRGRATE